MIQENIINSNPAEVTSFNGFEESEQNTMTKCGDMKNKGIKLLFGVKFECDSDGCSYRNVLYSEFYTSEFTELTVNARSKAF